MPHGGLVTAAPRQRRLDRPLQGRRPVGPRQLQDADHLARPGLFAMPAHEVRPQRVVARRPQAPRAALRQRRGARQRSGLAHQHVEVVLELEDRLEPHVQSLVPGETVPVRPQLHMGRAELRFDRVPTGGHGVRIGLHADAPAPSTCGKLISCRSNRSAASGRSAHLDRHRLPTVCVVPKIFRRILHRFAHERAGGEMHHGFRLEFFERGSNFISAIKVALDKSRPRIDRRAMPLRKIVENRDGMALI